MSEECALSGAAWRKSSFSSQPNDSCVEVADLPGRRAVRDSKNRDSGTLLLTNEAWATFTTGIRADNFD